jgi:DNA-3-methyladenine glycosylase I
MRDTLYRCPWGDSDPLYIEYHDIEWGLPLHEDQRLFEMLILEGAQAGLSWITILRKRENYRAAFDGFDPHKIARYDQKKITQLLEDPGIIRNKLKVNAAVANACAYLDIIDEFGALDGYLWGFVGGEPDPRIGCHEQRSQNAWLQIRRPHRLLRLYAGNRHGQRPSG